jgi:hypothetical protein
MPLSMRSMRWGFIFHAYSARVRQALPGESMRSMRSMRGGLFPVVEGPCKRYAMARHVTVSFNDWVLLNADSVTLTYLESAAVT